MRGDRRLRNLGINLIFFIVAVNIEPLQAQNRLQIFGYFSTRFEKTFSEPSVQAGQIVKETAPGEWTYPFFNVMAQHQIDPRFKVFANLDGSGAGNIAVKNFWGEYSAAKFLNIRLGKSYRKFGLYNELLDAVPTYYGIEPPELFDFDHLIVSRTTAFMVYGNAAVGEGKLEYSVSTDNGEGGAARSLVPLGGDLHYDFASGNLTFGVSGYTSGGTTTSDVALGGGSPKSGVLPWMAGDQFSVFGGYTEGRFGNLTLQGAFWQSQHDAERDPASVVTVVTSAKPNAAQRARFLLDPNGAVNEANVNVNGDYNIQTWYLRGGYSFETKVGEIAPYAQWDYYSNPETIAKKSYGGDNEAGVADDGKFSKSTFGVIFRPTVYVAVKFDQSFHFYKLNGENVNYPEVRLDVSFIFGQ